MEGTVGCSTLRSARENEAAKLIFGSAEIWRFDVPGNDFIRISFQNKKSYQPKTKIEL